MNASANEIDLTLSINRKLPCGKILHRREHPVAPTRPRPAARQMATPGRPIILVTAPGRPRCSSRCRGRGGDELPGCGASSTALCRTVTRSLGGGQTQTRAVKLHVKSRVNAGHQACEMGQEKDVGAHTSDAQSVSLSSEIVKGNPVEKS